MARWQSYTMLPASGADFELYIATLLADLGYEVEMTPQTRDFGADLLVREPSNDCLICVQVKFYSSVLDASPIQEVVASLPHYHAQEGWVITNSTFTQSAKTLAFENHVSLIDNAELNKLIQLVSSGGKPAVGTVKPFSNKSDFSSDESLRSAAEIVVSAGVGSVANIKRRLGLSYSESEKILSKLEEIGVVGPPNNSKLREVLVDSEELAALFGLESTPAKGTVTKKNKNYFFLGCGVFIILLFRMFLENNFG